MPEADRKWVTPANILTTVGIVVGALVGLFGVAFANPTGQRILCNVNSFFCDDIRVTSASLVADVFDYGAWCEDYVRRLQNMPEFDRPPGVGPYPGSADCLIDLSQSPEAAAFTQPLSSLPQGTNAIVTINLTLRHATPGRAIPFTVDFLCSHTPPGERYQSEIACDVLPLVVGDAFGGADPAVPDATYGASPRVALEPDAEYFARLWRLRIDGFENTDALAAGTYVIAANIARDREAMAQTEASVSFTID